MNREPIETRVVSLHDELRFGTGEPRYVYQPEGRLPWLQRLCFRILDRIAPAQPAVVERVVFSRTNIERVLSRVQDQYQVATRGNRDQAPTRLIIGARDWKEITLDAELPFYIEGSGPFRHSNLSRGERERIMKMDVEIVPWMRGIVVLP